MKKVVVIGNGMVGYKFCERLRKKATKEQFEIVVFGEEQIPAYDRVHLSEYFTNQSADGLILADKQWYAENDITLKTGQLITDIDRENRQVTTYQGYQEPYDILILATGSRAMVPPIEGTEKDGVFVYRTIEDLDSIINYGKSVKSAAVLGGGLLGLEAAKALMDMGLETHVIEFASKLMPRQLDDRASEVLKEKIESLGITIHLNKNTSKIEGNGKLTSLTFTEGQLNTDMLVISCGIVSRDELARKCGLEVSSRNGVIVNDLMQTTDTNIYAIGEAACHNNMVYGLVAPGYEMADVAIDQIAGTGDKRFAGNDMSTKLKLIGVDVASFGDAMGIEEGCKPVIFEDKNAGVYKKINISNDGKSLIGGILVGEADGYNQLLQIMQNGMALPKNPESLILGNRGGAEESAGFGTLPDTAQVCSCEDVTKGDIVNAIKVDGVTDLGELKKCSGAGTGCGACTPMVNDLLTDTLKSMGKTVRKVICEHFDHTRQELYGIIKVSQIRNYETLLNEYGQGDGCEICKPAVASLLASIWNDLVTEQDTIQDTNDRFLANIQKGGSYSIVPRVPGGEITPDQLIALGQVSKKFNLYTKITGGQRIDLFGASVDQLPTIWEELIAVGFESGHAYGKSLRTVKSCVGSAWCRYGLHDSVSFAIEVEKRYRGLRSPHKFKGGVSGCRRECAEAQSKDFGIIATEKGWNLYVCGNGGANPQHAQLLAGDIDSETCIKYLDRFLMFYIKTAEPLNRTATWLNKLEGGLDYLKEVVIDDSLGIAEELENQMAYMVDTYKCEWKEVVENPELRSKFQHYVNTEESDPNVKFEERRGQKVPVNW